MNQFRMRGVLSCQCLRVLKKTNASYRGGYIAFEYKQSVLGGDLGKRVSIEAGVSTGWERYIGPDGVAICMDIFGLSAPMSDLAIET